MKKNKMKKELAELRSRIIVQQERNTRLREMLHAADESATIHINKVNAMETANESIGLTYVLTNFKTGYVVRMKIDSEKFNNAWGR